MRTHVEAMLKQNSRSGYLFVTHYMGFAAVWNYMLYVLYMCIYIYIHMYIYIYIHIYTHIHNRGCEEWLRVLMVGCERKFSGGVRGFCRQAPPHETSGSQRGELFNLFLFYLFFFVFCFLYRNRDSGILRTNILITKTTRSGCPARGLAVRWWGVSRARSCAFFCAVFAEGLRRIAETLIFPCKVTNTYCGHLRRRRIRAKTAQTNIKVPAGEMPYSVKHVHIYISLSLSLSLSIYIYIYICVYTYTCRYVYLHYIYIYIS